MIFFTDIFYKELTTNNNRLKYLIFTSYLLNIFERGVTIDSTTLRPNINISPYGRWYWSNTEKIQNDSKVREKIYNKLLKYGKVINIDLINGEPWILGQLTESKTLKKVIRTRMRLNKKGDEHLGDILKNLLNIYIHAVNTPRVAYNIFKSKNNVEDIKKLEKTLDSSIYDILCDIESEIKEYNKFIINSYKNNLSVIEFDRRIVNSATLLLSNRDIIKEHRKYLQGHTHDRILLIAQNLYIKLGLIPIFTIHDSITYYINEKENENEVLEYINKTAKKLKTPITIEIFENK